MVDEKSNVMDLRLLTFRECVMSLLEALGSMSKTIDRSKESAK